MACRAIGLDIPAKEAIVYPFEMAITLDLAPTYYRNRRRFLLQQPDEGRIVYKVGTCCVVVALIICTH